MAHYRTGRHQARNVYRVNEQAPDGDTDEFVAVALVEALGPVIVDALNAYDPPAADQPIGVGE